MNEIAIIKLQLDKKKKKQKTTTTEKRSRRRATKQRLRGKQHIGLRPVIGPRRTRSAGTYGFRRLPS